MEVVGKDLGIDDYKSLSKSKRRELVNKYPLWVAYYCAVRLELALKAIVVALCGASAYVGVFEWSPTGAMVHLHYVLWKKGAPRFDLQAAQLKRKQEELRRVGILSSGRVECPMKYVVDFFEKYISEWNPNKDHEGKEEECHVAETVNQTQPHVASLSNTEMLQLLKDDMRAQRFDYYKRLVRSEHLHDWHYPDPLGAPNPSQPCATLLKGTTNMWYCKNGYPRDLVLQPQERAIEEDVHKPDLWHCRVCRNCRVMNNHIPGVSLIVQGNNDGQPVATKHQAVEYTCKYCGKHTKRSGTRAALFDLVDDMSRQDASAKEKYGASFEESKLGPKIHRALGCRLLVK